MGNAQGFGVKIDLDLAQATQTAREQELQVVKFDANFLTNFATQTFLRLFAAVQESARQTPAAVRTKHMVEQQHFSFIIEDCHGCRDGKALLPNPGDAIPHPRRKMAPNRTQELFKHESRRISRWSPMRGAELIS